MAACVAVISSLNHLLYIRTAECPDPLFYHFKAHSALDVVEDKLTRRSNYSGHPDHSDHYLGLLYPIEDHRLYGYVTNTKVKFVMIFETAHPINSQTANPVVHSLRDAEIRSMFQQLHQAYVDLVSAPFYEVNSPIEPANSSAARRFDDAVRKLLTEKPVNSGYCSTLTNLIDQPSKIKQTDTKPLLTN